MQLREFACVALVSVLCGVANAAPGVATPARAFPQHVAYAAGSIRPAVAQAQLDAATGKFYNEWRRKYLRPGCGGRYIYVAANTTAADDNAFINRTTLTVSEAHGYGMLIFAWMAGFDPHAKTYFDGMVRYWIRFKATSGVGLMAWNQVIGCANATKTPSGVAFDGGTSATDGDLDIAYALLLADKQWGSAGALNYRQLAISAIQAIRLRESNPITHHMLLGDWASPTSKSYYHTRPSDFTLSHWRAFALATKHAEWTNILNSTYTIIQRLQTVYSPVTGLLPDFAIGVNTGARPPTGQLLEQPTDGAYSYNACRTPWRIGMDFLLYGDRRALTAVTKINTWIQRKSAGDPAKIVNGYRLNGAAIGAGPDLPFSAPLGVSAMVSSANQAWLNKLWASVVAVPVTDGDYFGNTLKMLSMIAMSGNAWKP
jgi:endoglucanase